MRFLKQSQFNPYPEKRVEYVNLLIIPANGRRDLIRRLKFNVQKFLYFLFVQHRTIHHNISAIFYTAFCMALSTRDVTKLHSISFSVICTLQNYSIWTVSVQLNTFKSMPRQCEIPTLARDSQLLTACLGGAFIGGNTRGLMFAIMPMYTTTIFSYALGHHVSTSLYKTSHNLWLSTKHKTLLI